MVELVSKALAGVDEMTTIKLLVEIDTEEDTISTPLVTRVMEEIHSCLEYDASLFDFHLIGVSVTEIKE